MERKKTSPHTPPTRPVQAVINDQKRSDAVMIHLRLNLSPRKPASGVVTASVQKSDVFTKPIWRSVR